MSPALPGHPWLQRRGSALWLDGCSLDALADRFGTPLYVYSRSAMEAAARAYLTPLAGRDHLLCYAMKANSSLAVLQVFAQLGCGFDIVSGGELARVIAAGADPRKVVFSGVGKTRAEMAQALAADVLCFNVESEAELEVLSQVAVAHGRTARVSLRVNPNVDAGTHPYISTGLKDNKFGVAHADAVTVYRRAAALPGLQVVGIDCHIGSQVTQAAPYLDAVDRLLDLVEQAEAAGVPIPHVDLGGGLGITYTDEAPPDPSSFVRQMLQRIDARGHSHRKILLEPGRSMVGNAGVLLTEVLYLKPGETKHFCIVDAAMNDLLRPALYEATMDVQPCRQRDDAPAQVWDIVGPVCESSDWLARERRLALRAGDRLAVLSAGAYGMAMASNYNTRARPAEVLVADGRATEIRPRETLRELFASERLAEG